ncbi:MAG: hypothetical protein U0838_08985 [Chloroflexota bacterium]
MLGTLRCAWRPGRDRHDALYYLAKLHEHGGLRVEAWHVGLMQALFYASELASPVFRGAVGST